MRAFVVVRVHEPLGHFTDLLERGRPVDLQALLIVAAMIPFDKRVFLWALGRADIGLDAQRDARSGERARESHDHWHCRPIWDLGRR
jgi:hypothetical protein